MDQERWKFFAERRNWRSLGPIDEPGAPQMYTHPSSPQLGEGWLKSDVVSFEHMKVTNNAALAEDACVLRSAQKYRLAVCRAPRRAHDGAAAGRRDRLCRDGLSP